MWVKRDKEICPHETLYMDVVGVKRWQRDLRTLPFVSRDDGKESKVCRTCITLKPMVCMFFLCSVVCTLHILVGVQCIKHHTNSRKCKYQ